MPTMTSAEEMARVLRRRGAPGSSYDPAAPLGRWHAMLDERATAAECALMITLDLPDPSPELLRRALDEIQQVRRARADLVRNLPTRER